MANLWENDNQVSEIGIEVPRWIDKEITPYDIAGICKGGCSSGAYMPAVTYHEASATMERHGDDVLDYIDEVLGEIPAPDMSEQSWSGLACYFLSMAVELWASSVEDEIDRALDELEEEQEENDDEEEEEEEPEPNV